MLERRGNPPSHHRVDPRVLRTREGEHRVLGWWLAEACAILIRRGLSGWIVDRERPVPESDDRERSIVSRLGKIGDGDNKAEENRGA